jgi:hypothetical protein
VGKFKLLRSIDICRQIIANASYRIVLNFNKELFQLYDSLPTFKIDKIVEKCQEFLPVFPLSSGSAIRGRNANLWPISPVLSIEI